MLENLLKFYWKSCDAIKKKIPGCISAEKLVKKTEVGRPKTEVFQTARFRDRKCECESGSVKKEQK